jgi:hypothetical protein
MSKAGSKPITVMVTEEEIIILDAYCEQTSRTKTEVIRAYLRSLKRKLSASSPSRGVD